MALVRRRRTNRQQASELRYNDRSSCKRVHGMGVEGGLLSITPDRKKKTNFVRLVRVPPNGMYGRTP